VNLNVISGTAKTFTVKDLYLDLSMRTKSSQSQFLQMDPKGQILPLEKDSFAMIDKLQVTELSVLKDVDLNGAVLRNAKLVGTEFGLFKNMELDGLQ